MDVRDRPQLHTRLDGAWPWQRVVAGLPEGEPVAALAGAWAAHRVLALRPTRTLRDDAVLDLLGGLPLERRDLATARTGWWVGYLGYQMGSRLDAGRGNRPHETPLPHAWAAYYPNVACTRGGRWWLDGVGASPDEVDAWRAHADASTQRLPAWRLGPMRREVSPDAHRASIARALEHIAAGDIYQANVCQHLDASCSGSPAALFAAGQARLDTPYRAFVSGPWGAVASFSPELFLRWDGQRLVTAPIKGTARRDGAGDAPRAQLLASAKDRAENAMIVDLMRNDLGRIAVTGSVEADRLFAAESHPGVWHLVSTISCRPRPDLSLLDVFGATFPPGSVTGAPKIRAMEVIDDLETVPLAAYTGTVFVIDSAGRLTASVIIRTVEIAGGRARLGVGSGIVADSDPSAEDRECFDKARPIVAALGSRIDDDHASV